MNSTQSFDLIGDIHGHAYALNRLLKQLGYSRIDGSHLHPEGRKVIFLGDFVDRGPAIRETLQIVRELTDSGNALAVMGNHEYNAVCYHTPDGNGGHLRPHSEKNRLQHQATLDAFEGREEEWDDWIRWFQGLPFCLELDGLRAVHAVWDVQDLAFLEGKSLQDESFLHASAEVGTREYETIETVLKGCEINLPAGNFFEDKEGLRRSKIRVRWWEDPDGKTYRDVAIPTSDTLSKEPLPRNDTPLWEPYPAAELPVFVGHYWLPGDSIMKPLAPNIACLDYSVAKGAGKLAAYRWDGESRLTPDHFIAVPAMPVAGK